MALWTAKPENRHLPLLREWIGIRWFTNKKKWTPSSRRMMKKSAKVNSLRLLAVTVLTITLLGGGFYASIRITALNERNFLQSKNEARAVESKVLAQRAQEEAERRALEAESEILELRASETKAAKDLLEKPLSE
jgi:hypothetical protein